MMSDTTSNMPAPDNAGVHLMRSECLLQGGSLSVKSLLALAAASPAAAAEVAQQCVHAVDAVQLSADPDAAIEFLVQVTDVCAGTLGETHPATGALRCRLGDLLLAERCLEQARQQYEIVLAAHRPNVLGDSDVIARALSGLGDVLRTERKYVAALMCLQRALRRQSETHSVHPATAQTHTRLGALWFEQQRYTTARFHFQEALAIREATLGPRDPAVAQSLHNLGVTLAALGDLRSARVCLAQALAIREDRLGRTHLATAQSLEALSRCWRILVTTRAHNTVSSAPPRSIVNIQGIAVRSAQRLRCR